MKWSLRQRISHWLGSPSLTASIRDRRFLERRTLGDSHQRRLQPVAGDPKRRGVGLGSQHPWRVGKRLRGVAVKHASASDRADEWVERGTEIAGRARDFAETAREKVEPLVRGIRK